MSYLLSIVPCEDLQGLLEENFANIQPLEHLPVIDWVFSDMNLSPVLNRQVSPGGGKIKNVNLVYTPRQAESDAETTIDFQCSSDNEAGQLTEPYTLDTTQGVYVSEKFSAANLKTMCRSNGNWFAARILAMQDLALRKLESVYTAQLSGLVGTFASDDTDLSMSNMLKTVSTRDADGNVKMDFWEEISYTQMLSEFASNPIVFGSGDMTKAVKNVYAGCCASYGMDLGEFASQNPFTYFHSNRLANVLEADHFLMLHPGQVQPLWFNLWSDEDGNPFSVDTPIQKSMVIEDFRYGLPWDYTFKLDCGNIFVEIALATKLVGLPTDLYSEGDRLEGYTGVLEFAISNS